MSIFAGMIAVAGALCAAEEKYLAPWAASQLGAHLPKATALKLPPAYGAVLLVNLVGATMVLIALGMRVGRARKQFKVEVSQTSARTAHAWHQSHPLRAQSAANRASLGERSACKRRASARGCASARVAPALASRRSGLQRLHAPSSPAARARSTQTPAAAQRAPVQRARLARPCF